MTSSSVLVRSRCKLSDEKLRNDTDTHTHTHRESLTRSVTHSVTCDEACVVWDTSWTRNTDSSRTPRCISELFIATETASTTFFQQPHQHHQHHQRRQQLQHFASLAVLLYVYTVAGLGCTGRTSYRICPASRTPPPRCVTQWLDRQPPSPPSSSS